MSIFVLQVGYLSSLTEEALERRYHLSDALDSGGHSPQGLLMVEL